MKGFWRVRSSFLSLLGVLVGLLGGCGRGGVDPAPPDRPPQSGVRSPVPAYSVVVDEMLLRPTADSSWLLPDRKSTRLNSSHVAISYAVFCVKTKISRET